MRTDPPSMASWGSMKSAVRMMTGNSRFTAEPDTITTVRLWSGRAARLRGIRRVFLADYLDEAAEWEEVDAIEGLAEPESQEPGREPDTELGDPGAEPLGGDKVGGLVDEDEESQDGEDQQPGGQVEHADYAPATSSALFIAHWAAASI